MKGPFLLLITCLVLSGKLEALWDQRVTAGECADPRISGTLPIRLGEVDSRTMEFAATVLRAMPTHTSNMTDLADTIDRRKAAQQLRQRLGDRAGGALLGVIGQSGTSASHLWFRAAAIYMTLELPSAPLEALLFSSELGTDRQLALFWALREKEAPISLSSRSTAQGPALSVGPGRLTFLCRLAGSVAANPDRVGSEEASLLAAALSAIRDEAVRGSTMAETALQDSTVALATRILESKGYLSHH